MVSSLASTSLVTWVRVIRPMPVWKNYSWLGVSRLSFYHGSIDRWPYSEAHFRWGFAEYLPEPIHFRDVWWITLKQLLTNLQCKGLIDQPIDFRCHAILVILNPCNLTVPSKNFFSHFHSPTPSFFNLEQALRIVVSFVLGWSIITWPTSITLKCPVAL